MKIFHGIRSIDMTYEWCHFCYFIAPARWKQSSSSSSSLSKPCMGNKWNLSRHKETKRNFKYNYWRRGSVKYVCWRVENEKCGVTTCVCVCARDEQINTKLCNIEKCVWSSVRFQICAAVAAGGGGDGNGDDDWRSHWNLLRIFFKLKNLNQCDEVEWNHIDSLQPFI